MNGSREAHGACRRKPATERRSGFEVIQETKMKSNLGFVKLCYIYRRASVRILKTAEMLREGSDEKGIFTGVTRDTSGLAWRYHRHRSGLIKNQ